MKQTFIAGPCVIESAELLDTVAAELVEINKKLGTDIIFKASFDKANRTSLKSFRVCDILQIPAFLCRQTDLLIAAAKTGRTVNIKKGQFLSGEDMRYPVEKAREAGATEVWLTERGNMMGYHNLVVDFRNIPEMLEIVDNVIMDCTHSVQHPGGANGKTDGDRRYVPQMAMAAKAFGATGWFFEVHPNPDQGLSDAANMLELSALCDLVAKLLNNNEK